MPIITKQELNNHKFLIESEKRIFQKFYDFNDNISKMYYDGEIIIIQFHSGYKLDSDYLERLRDLVDYSSYHIENIVVTNEIFKIKYDENVLQLTIIL